MKDKQEKKLDFDSKKWGGKHLFIPGKFHIHSPFILIFQYFKFQKQVLVVQNCPVYKQTLPFL